MFDKLFGRGRNREQAPEEPAIIFGRYSDNNKPLAKANRWTEADNLFKEKKYPETLDAFFDYLADEETGNVSFQREGPAGRFSLYQGSKIVRGSFDGDRLNAEVSLARMEQPSVPVMRRLLEMNFSLFYSRYALDDTRLCMRFDTDISTASPSKLYYGLKELATKADKQDDLLVGDFASLKMADNEHVTEPDQQEKEVKYRYFQQWINETLNLVAAMDADKMSGGIAYTLLCLIYRIDYLVCPEGRLLNELEKTGAIYFKKDERPVQDKNRDMTESFRVLKEFPREDFFNCLIRSRHTFSIVAPQPYKTITDSVHAANQNMVWYRDNGHPRTAMEIMEYGIAYCQYSYSMPRVITELFHLYMQVNYAGYFRELGFSRVLYEESSSRFDTQAIIHKIRDIQQRWKDKYPQMDFKTDNLRFDSLQHFNHTFTNELEFLNMESR